MSEEVQEKIFEPYFTTKDTGSGIGLTMVYKIVKEHSGEINVISHEGKGTTVTLSFPIPQKEQHLLSWNGESA
jgi:signal transduction histidine kinase